MKTNNVNSIETAMNKLEVLNNESSKNIVGGIKPIKITITVTVTIG